MMLMTKENSQRISNLEQTVTRLAENVAELSGIIRYQDKRQHEIETKMGQCPFPSTLARRRRGGLGRDYCLFSWLMRGILAKF